MTDTRKYRTELPNMADDELGPFEFRLYAHYKRVCGEKGVCYEGVRTTAERTKMSLGQVVESRRVLQSDGWIFVTQVNPSQPFHIEIVDRWKENGSRFDRRSQGEQSKSEEDERSPGEHDVAPITEERSVHTVNTTPDFSIERSPGEHTVHTVNTPIPNSPVERSPGEQRKFKKEPIKKEQIQEDETPEPAAAHKHPAVQAFRESAHQYPPKAWYSKIAEVIGEDPATLKRWQAHVLDWVGHGWNPGNAKGMLDSFQQGGIQGKNSSKPSLDKGPDEDPERAERDKAFVREQLRKQQNANH